MSFERIWTGALAGAFAALFVTLAGAAGQAMLLPDDPLGRETLTSVYLAAWGALTIGCLIPSSTLRQWLAALWISFGALVLLAAVYALRLPAPAPIAVMLVVAILAAAIALALRGKGRAA